MWWIIGILGYLAMWFIMSMINIHNTKKSDDKIDYTESTVIGLVWPFSLPIFILIKLFDFMRWVVRKVDGNG